MKVPVKLYPTSVSTYLVMAKQGVNENDSVKNTIWNLQIKEGILVKITVGQIIENL